MVARLDRRRTRHERLGIGGADRPLREGAAPCRARRGCRVHCSLARGDSRGSSRDLRLVPYGRARNGLARGAGASAAAECSRIYWSAFELMNTARLLMDRRVKERLIGATILVALIVLIVPELLSGPKPAPVPPLAAGLPSPTRSVSVNLATSKATPQPQAADAASEGAAGTRAAGSSASGGGAGASTVSGAAPPGAIAEASAPGGA